MDLCTDGSTVESYKGTQLGQAVLSSALSPDEGLTVFAELRKARQCLVLENDLHIVYLVSTIEIIQVCNFRKKYVILSRFCMDMLCIPVDKDSSFQTSTEEYEDQLCIYSAARGRSLLHHCFMQAAACLLKV